MWKKYSSLLDKKLKRWLTCSLILSCIEILPVLGVTFCIQHALNNAIAEKNISRLILDGASVFFFTLLIALLALLSSRLALKINQKMAHHIYERIIEKSIHSNPILNSNEADSDQTIVHDADKFHSMGTLFLIRSLPAAFVSLSIAVFLFFIDYGLALLLFGGAPLLYFGGQSIEKKMKELGWVNLQSHKKFSEGIRFLFDMKDLIQTQTAEGVESERQRENLKTMGKHLRQFIWQQTLYSISQNFIVSAISITILIAGGIKVVQGKMLWGYLISFYVAVGMLKRYIQSLISSIPTLIEGELSFAKLDAFLRKPELSLYQGTRRIDFKGSLRLENISFRFHQRPLLQNISLSIQTGEIMALFGPNGSGKSTLMNLVLGFLRPEKGAIFFDEKPIETLDLRFLRHQIGILRQNPLLFSGTIKENILYGSLDQHLEMHLDLLSFVEDLPNRWDTLIGPSGFQLSGGQKQKLSLVRALIRRPKLLLLDEPTNHLDADSLSLIFSHLQKWKQEMAILVISHYRPLLRYVDHTYDLTISSPLQQPLLC